MLFGLFHAILIIIVQKPNTLRPRGFRLCEPFGLYQVKMKESELNQVAQTDSALNILLIKYCKEQW